MEDLYTDVGSAVVYMLSSRLKLFELPHGHISSVLHPVVTNANGHGQSCNVGMNAIMVVVKGIPHMMEHTCMQAVCTPYINLNHYSNNYTTKTLAWKIAYSLSCSTCSCMVMR